MNEKFYDLKKEKQDSMINGAMEVFARSGYRRASTDDMVKVSGISKGLWFHYFENKRGLYDFIVGYGIKYAVMEYENMRTDNMTVFELLKCFERTKMILMEKYPYLPLLIVTVMEERDEEAIQLINDDRDTYKTCLESLMYRVDIEKLTNDNVSHEDLTRISYMVDSAFRRTLKECYNEPVFRRDYYLTECYDYLDLIEKII